MAKTKLQIKSIFGSILFEHEQEDNSTRATTQKFLEQNKGKWIENADLSNMDLSGIDFTGAKFDNSKFYNSKFDNSKFYNSKFDNSTFYNSTFDNSKFYNSTFDNSTFDNSKFYNSKFYNSKFDNSTFYNSKFDNSTFYNSTFDNSKFDNSTFYNSTFDEATLKALNDSGALEPVKFDFFGRMLVLQHEVPALRKALIDGQVKGTSYTDDCCCFIGTIAKAKKCNYKNIAGIKPDASSDTERWFMGILSGHTPENSLIVKQTVAWIDEFLSYLQYPATV